MIWPTNVESLPEVKFTVSVHRNDDISDVQIVEAADSGFVADADVFYIKRGTSSWFYPLSTVKSIRVDRQ